MNPSALSPLLFLAADATATLTSRELDLPETPLGWIMLLGPNSGLINVILRLIVGGEEGPIIGRGNYRSSGEQRKVEKEATVQRNLDDLLVIDDVADGGRFGLHAGGLCFHVDEGGGVADLEARVGAVALADLKRKRTLNEGLETLNLDPERIRPRARLRELIGPG